jgi:hypothetical protein
MEKWKPFDRVCCEFSGRILGVATPNAEMTPKLLQGFEMDAGYY